MAFYLFPTKRKSLKTERNGNLEQMLIATLLKHITERTRIVSESIVSLHLRLAQIVCAMMC